MRYRYENFISVGPGSLAGRFLRKYWQPIFQADKLKGGRPAPVRVLEEDFTLYRGDSGAVYLVGPRCPHRGLVLAAGRVVGENLQCFYHGWTFDGSGQCVAQPAEPVSFAQKMRIPAYPTREYIGLIFAYLGEGEPPSFPTLDVYNGQGYIHLRESKRPWPFFTQIENSVDESHFNFAHRRTKFDEIGINSEIPELSCEETDYGFIRIGKRGNAVRTGHFFMPNWSLSSLYEHDMGFAEHLVWRVPVDDHSHTSFMADFVYKTGEEARAFKEKREAGRARTRTLEPAMSLVERILKGEMHADDVPADRPDIVMIQDAVSCMGQGVRDREDDHLGASDRQVSMLRKLWSRELRAIDEGRPVKDWRVPRNLTTTKGIADE